MGLRTSPGAAVIQRLPAMLDDGLVNLARLSGSLGAAAGTQRKSFPFAEQLDFHRPRADLDLSALVGEYVFVKTVTPVRRIPF